MFSKKLSCVEPKTVSDKSLPLVGRLNSRGDVVALNSALNPHAVVFQPKVGKKGRAANQGGNFVFRRRTVDNVLIEVSHPLIWKEFEQGLSSHPDKKFRDFILRTISEGADIGADLVVSSSTPVARCKNSSSVQDLSVKVRQEIMDDVSIGARHGPFRRPPFQGSVCSPIAAIPKGDSDKIRLIHNLSAPRGQSVNDAISMEFATTEYDRFDSAVSMVRKVGTGAWMAKIDLKSAFKHIVVRPDQWHLLGMHLDADSGEREYFFDATLPFGLRSSPKIFNEFTKAIVYIARTQEGVKNIFGYLDDFFVVASSREECAENLSRLKGMASRQGWRLNQDKERGPLQVLDLLGIEIDAPKQQLRVTEKRLRETLLLLDDWKEKKFASRREVASLVGKLSFLSLVCRPGRVFLRRALDTLRSVSNWDSKIKIDDGLLLDVHWWRTFLPEWNGVSIFPAEEWLGSPDISLTTDACNHGFGAHFSGLWLYGGFEGWLYQQSMPFKEFFAIVAAVATWGHMWRGMKIRFFTDSYTVFQCIQLRRARTPAMAALFRLLYWYCARYDCFVGAAHIPGVENSEADAISRAEFSRFFQLQPYASPYPSPIPTTLMTQFFSELGSSQAGRNCLEPESRQQKLDGQQASSVHRRPPQLGTGLRFGEIVCGRSAMAGPKLSPSVQEDPLRPEPIPQGEVGMGGGCGGSVRTFQIEGIGPPVGHFDIEFGWDPTHGLDGGTSEASASDIPSLPCEHPPDDSPIPIHEDGRDAIPIHQEIQSWTRPGRINYRKLSRPISRDTRVGPSCVGRH